MLLRKFKGTAVALLAVYVFLFTLLLSSYVRVAWTIHTNPGLVPCGIGGGPAGHEKDGSAPELGVPQNEREKEKRQGPNDNREQTTRPGDAASTLRGRDRWYENISHSDSTDGIPLDSGERLRAIPYTSTTSRSSRTPSPQPDFALQLDPPPQAHTTRRSSLISQQPIYVQSLPSLLGPQQPLGNGLVSRPQAIAQWMLPQNLNEFYNMDAFICESDGLPRWCFHCNCWKPDRSHHCGELGRCVKKMDHFCPWLAAFSSVDLLLYLTLSLNAQGWWCCWWDELQVLLSDCVLWSALLLLSLDYHRCHDKWSEKSSKYTDYLVGIAWLVTLPYRGNGLGNAANSHFSRSCSFLLFCAGMTSTTTQFILRNTTTIDNLSAATKVYQIAIFDPHTRASLSRDSAYASTHERSTPASDRSSSQMPQSNVTVKRLTFPDSDPALANIGMVSRRTFVIAKTVPGENPWRLEKRIDNFKEVMGERVWDWFLPIKHSPCSTRNTRIIDSEGIHIQREGMYKFNSKLMERLKRECGIRSEIWWNRVMGSSKGSDLTKIRPKS